MRQKPQILWIKDPSATTIAVGSGDFAGELTIDGQIKILADSATACIKECATPCVKNSWLIEFQDIDFGSCNDCGKQLGFVPVLQRHPDFDNQTYLDYTNRKPYVYDGEKSGTLTGAQQATYFLALIASLMFQNDQHDQFYVTAVAGANANEIILTYPCTGLVTYQLEGIFHPENNNLLDAELPVFTELVSGEEAVLSREKLLKHFPDNVGRVFGEAPGERFTWCGNTCIIKLKGCIDPCSDWTNHNSGFMHSSATPIELYLYVNSDAPGFADFIDSLNTNFTACTLDGTVGTNGECYQQVIAGASVVIDVDNLLFNAAGDTFSLTNGATTLNVFDVTSGADLQAKLTAAFPSGTFVYAAGPPATLTVSGVFVATAPGTTGSIVLCRVAPYRNMAGDE